MNHADGAGAPELSNDSPPAPIRAALFPGHWAYGADEAYLIKDSVVPLVFLLSGNRSTLEYPIRFETMVPAGVTLYADRPMTETARGDHHQYTIELSEHDVIKKLDLREELSPPAFIELWAEANELLEDATLQWKMSFDGFSGPEQSAALIVKPPLLEGPRPEQFGVLFVWSLHHDVPRSIWDKVYSVYRQAGINTWLADGVPPNAGTWADYCLRRFRENGGRVLLNAMEERRPLEKLGTEHWEPLVVEGGVETFARLDDGHTARWADRVDGFYWDFEASGGQISPHQEARDLFARRKGMKESELTAEVLESEYKEEYESFCEDLVGEVANIWGEFVRQHKPGAPLYLCHGDHMDPAVYRGLAGMTQQPMIYTGTTKAFVQVFEQISDAVPKDLWPFSWNGLVKADKRRYVAMSPNDMRMNILAVAALGGAGLGHWPDFHRAMDGLYLWEMARAAHTIGQVEPFLIRGNQIDRTVKVAGLPESETKVEINGKIVTLPYPDWTESLVTRSYQMYNERLITILNVDSDKAAYVNVAVSVHTPSDEYKVRDAVSGTLFVQSNSDETWNGKQLRKGFTVKVEPMDAVFLRIGLEDPDGGDGAINVSDTHGEYLALKAESESTGGGGILQEDNLEITWDDIDGDGSLELLLASPVQKVWITPAGGRVWGWKVKDRSEDLIRRGETLGAGMDLFWMPNVVRWNTGESNPYRVSNRAIAAGRASVTVEKAINTKVIPGLLISKTYSIDAESQSIRVDVKFTSESSNPLIRFGYWSHSSFDMGNTEKLVWPGPGGTTFREPDGTVKSITALSSTLSAQQKKAADEIDPAAIKDFGPITEGWFATFSAKTKEAIVVTLDHEALLQIYKWQPWSSDNMDTLEWMYKTVALKPQESRQTRMSWEYKERFATNSVPGL
jgi:hypothetical protein